MIEIINYSASSLQDYMDCPRRFKLRYITNLTWPAIVSEPVLENELNIQRGLAFHKLAHQFFIGIPANSLDFMVGDNVLEGWWQSFVEKQAELIMTDGHLYPEVSLSAGIGDRRLIAKYDLVLIKKNNSAQIIDWKTGRSIPKRNWLIDRMQTRIYPYLLARSGSQLNNGVSIDPDQIELIYWFVEHQGKSERITYSQNQYLQDQNFLENLIVKINSQTDPDFPMTDNHRRCEFCVYRSLCDRGVVAGTPREGDEYYFDDGQAEIELNFDQIAEIAF